MNSGKSTTKIIQLPQANTPQGIRASESAGRITLPRPNPTQAIRKGI